MGSEIAQAIKRKQRNVFFSLQPSLEELVAGGAFTRPRTAGE